MRLRVRVAPGPQHLYGEESLFAAYPHLTGTSFVLQFASLLVGRGFFDFLVWGVAEMIAVQFDGPAVIVTDDAENGSFRTFLHARG